MEEFVTKLLSGQPFVIIIETVAIVVLWKKMNEKQDKLDQFRNWMQEYVETRKKTHQG